MCNRKIIRRSLQLVSAIELHERLPQPGEDGDDGSRVDRGAILEAEDAEVVEVGDEVAAAGVDRRTRKVQVLQKCIGSPLSDTCAFQVLRHGYIRHKMNLLTCSFGQLSVRSVRKISISSRSTSAHDRPGDKYLTIIKIKTNQQHVLPPIYTLNGQDFQAAFPSDAVQQRLQLEACQVSDLRVRARSHLKLCIGERCRQKFGVHIFTFTQPLSMCRYFHLPAL